MTPSTDIAVVDQQRELVAFLDGESLQTELQAALPEGVAIEKFTRALKTALLEDPDVLVADRRSLYKALLKAAEYNLIPDGQESALVAYNDRESGTKMLSFLPMIQGVRKMLAEYGWSLRTAVIWDNDQVEYDLADAKLLHRPARLGTERGARIGAWALAVHKDGRRELEVYDAARIEDVRKKSSKTDKFWTKWPDQMWEKTVAHRLAKKLPLDPKDKERVDRLLADIEGTSSAVDALYGRDTAPANRTQDGRALPGAAAAREKTPSPAAAPSPDGSKQDRDDSSSTGDGAAAATADESLQEPTDEELDRMAAEYEAEQQAAAQSEDEQTTIDGEATEVDGEPVFPDGPNAKHAGKTIQEVYDEGTRGQSYVRWAVSHRASAYAGNPELIAALERWAEEHGQVA